MLDKMLSAAGARRIRPVAVLAIFLLLALFAAILLRARTAALDIPTFHLDGAFQTASGLFRLSEGQLPGRDFFSYLGVGLLGLLYPLFLVFGGDLSASVAAANVATLAALVFVTYVVFRMIDQSASRTWALVFGTLTLVPVVFPALEIAILTERSLPGNSLRPLRALLPYAVIYSTMLVLNSQLSVSRKLVFSGLLAAGCFAWSNDFASPTAAMVLLGTLAWMFQHGLLGIQRLATLGAVFVVSVAAVFIITSFGYPLEAMSYNFQDVRRDQYWYFGPWFYDARIFCIEDIPSKLLPDYGYKLWLLPVLLAAAGYLRRMDLLWLALVGLACFLGSAIATIGGHRGDYQVAYDHWAFLAFWASVWVLARRVASSAMPDSGADSASVRSGGARTLRFVTAGLALALVGQSLADYQATRRLNEEDEGRYFEPALGGYLDVEWRDYIAMARASDGLTVQEEYWGLWSAVRREFSPKVDSVIHALGRVRDSYFADADLVTTTRVSMSKWQPWSFSANYWFYSHLLTGYRVVEVSPTTLVWARLGESEALAPQRSCQFSRQQGVFRLPDAPPGLYEVDLILDGSLVPPRGLLLVKNELNIVAGARGFLSLDPSVKRHRLPVSISTEGHLFATAVLHSNGYTRPEGLLRECLFRPLPETPPDFATAHAAQYQAFPLTDENWTRGVANFDAGFFVNNSAANRGLYVPGALVRFDSGNRRRVRNVASDAEFLYVLLEGEPLDPTVYGFPARFTVENE